MKDDGFHFQINNVGPDGDDSKSLFVPMDRMKDFVKVVSLLDKFNDPEVWKCLNTYKMGECIASYRSGG